MNKFNFNFEKQYFYRNQSVYRETEPAEYLYIVIDGEFEVSKTITKKVKKEKDISKYISHDAMDINKVGK